MTHALPRLPASLGTHAGAVIVAGEDGVITTATAAAERMFACGAEELAGLHLLDLIPARDRGVLRDGGAPWSAEAIGPGRVMRGTAVRRDGTEFEAEVFVQVSRTKAGLTFNGFVRDCTASSRESEEWAGALLQHSSHALLLVDGEGAIRYSSAEARQLFSPNGDALEGGSALAFVHPEQREWMASIFRAATTRDADTTQAFRATGDGASRWLEVTISNQLRHPILGSMILSYHDITDRVEALNRLWQREEQYRAIVEAVTDAILILDLSGVIVTANEAACEMYGYALGELIGKAASDLVSPADRPRLEPFALLAAASEPFYAELVHLRKDGSEVNVVMHGTSFQMGGSPHLLAVISNVSDRKRMQQRLERAERISGLGRVAVTIAHEMNNVMMGLVPFAEIIRRRTLDDPVLQNAVAHILKNTERGKSVTHDILRFARATGAPASIVIEASSWLAGVTGELNVRLPAHIRLDVRCEEGLFLLGDSAQLQQVVLNLVLNAFDSMPGEGVVAVSLVTCTPEAFAPFAGGEDRIEEYAHLSVRDSGHGIPPHLMNQIFEPLFTTRGSRGTGLGLAIVHQIVMAHDGRIHVVSVPGEGSTFHVVLRKSIALAPSLSGEVAEGVWRSIRSVVLVEDEPSVGEGLSQLLRLEGVECEWIPNGHLALERLRSDPPDLLILDVGLPDMNGVDLYRAVAKRFPLLPVIFSTGHADHRLLDRLDPTAPVGFLSKPYGLEALTLRVSSLLLGRRTKGSR